jgi:hypothetical protein
MDSLFFDFNEITPPQRIPTPNERRFIRSFLSKIQIEYDEYNEIMISNTSPVDFSYFVLYLVREYEKQRKNDPF